METYITYKSTLTDNYQIKEPIIYTSKYPNITKIELSTKKKQLCELHIKFFLDGVNSFEEAQQITASPVQEILTLFSFQMDVSVSEPSVTDVIPMYKFGLSSLGASITVIKHVSDHKLKQIQHLLGRKIVHNPYVKLHREAMATGDVVTRFLYLYSILYKIKGNQKNVDAFIKSVEPNVQEMQSTKKTSDKETIYTWLRNQVGHVQETSDLMSVRSKMTLYFSTFADIVRDEIKQLP